MKRILFFMAILVMSISQGIAQVSDYSFTATTGTFDTLVGGTNVSGIEADYAISGSISIGFTFKFDGTNYTDVKVGSDGFISFNTSASAQTTNNLDGVGAGNRPLVAPLWDDLAGGATGGISYASHLTTGTAPNRVFTFEWKNWEWNYSSSTPVMTFQVKLYETTNVIEFLYKQESGTVSSGSASIGLTGASTFLSLNNSGAMPSVSSTTETDTISVKPATGQIYTFTPPSCPTPTALTVSGITTTGANLAWTESGSATLWQYEYDTTGFTQGTGTKDTTSMNPVSIAGLTAETDYDVYVRAICGSGDSSMWTGPISFSTPPSCPAPDTLSVSNVLGTSVNFDWSEMGSATLWQYEYDTAGFTQGTGTKDTTSMNPVSITGLTAETDYQYYVRAVCGAGDSSVWVGPYSFTTLCAAVTAPWSESFATTSIPNCWNQGAGNSENWLFGSSGGHVGNAGTIGGSTMSGGNFAWVDDSTPHNSNTALESPLVDVSGLTDPQLAFYLISNNEGQTNVDFSIDIWDGSAWNVGFYTRDSNTVNGEWEEITLSLSSLTISGPVRVRFIVDETNGSGFYDDVAIDDVRLRETPSCVDVSALVASGVSNSSVTLGWTENGTATLWQYEYDTAGFTQGTGTMDTTSMNPAMISGLTATTSYEFYVRSICGAGDSSAWVGPISITTLCAPVTAPWSESFATTSIPGCWNQGLSNSENWRFNLPASSHIGNVGNIGGSTISGGNFAWVDDSNPHNSNTALESPLVDVSGLTAPMLSFYIISNNEGQTNVDFSIDIWDGSAWNVGFYTRDSNTYNGEWEEINLSLSSLTISGPVRLRFIVDETNGSGFYDDVAIDDVRLRETPSCFDVSQLSVSGITDNSAMFGWTENGTATLWQYEYDTAGFTQGTGTIDTTSSNPYTASGLTSNTDYEFYIRAVCAPGDTANWVGPMAFTTNCGPVVSFPYLEGFEDTSSTRNCWSNIQEAGNADWTYGSGASGGSITSAYEGSKNARFVAVSGSNSPVTKLVSPIMDLSGLTAPVLSFYYGQQNWGSDQNYTRVLYRTSAASNWVEIWSDSSSVSTWTNATVVLPNASATYQIAFEGINNYGRRNVVDRVFVGDTLTATAVVDSNATCFGVADGGATVTANGGLMPYTYSWSNGATTTSITGLTAGVYTVTVADAAGDSIVSSVTITQPGQVVVSLGNDTSICVNDMLTLDAGSGFSSYLWDNGVTTQTRMVNSSMAASNAYSVIVTNASGCNGYDTVNVNINAPIMPNLGNDTTICYDATLVLDAGAGFNSYLWDDASTLQTRDVVGMTVGSAVHTMHVTTTDANMCTGRDTIVVTVDAEITVDLGNDTTVCSGTTFDLDAGAGYASYLWDDLSTAQTRTVATNAAGATNYSVIVTTTAGCIGTSTIEVTGRAPVVVNLGPDTAIGWWGADTTYTLDAGSGFASYLWSDGTTTTQTFVVNKTNMGLIGVVVTDANGCMGTDTVRVDFLLSVPSFDVSTLKMYPNPASEQINIEMSNFNNVDEVNVKFISITGEVVLRRQINVNGGAYLETFDVSHLATGTYFVQFEAKGEVVTRKFVIK